ncbi:proteasome assembly chaperone family protein [Candidatus Bathyarchaeota archaeon]|nr:MAG: proteasome assembly chaperone family protein [Candidatus Bathyarchaeota archaeon]
MSERVKIVERTEIPDGLKIIFGLPDVGLVGTIAASHLISKLNLKEIAYLRSDLLPPVIMLEKGLPRSPIRMFGNEDLLVLNSEIAIPSASIYLIIENLVNWVSNKKVEIVFTLGGLPIPNRHEIEKPKVFGAASSEDLLKLLNEKGIQAIQRGFLVGPQALILSFCAERDIPAVALLAESFYNYPDPEASSMVIQALNRIIDMEIDVSELIEKGEEVRLAMRDMMRRTQAELARMKKSHEYDIPGYYIK